MHAAYQNASYTVIVVQQDGNGKIVKGPIPFDASQTTPLEVEVMELKVNRMYSVTVTLETLAGTSNSSDSFSKPKLPKYYVYVIQFAYLRWLNKHNAYFKAFIFIMITNFCIEQHFLPNEFQ